MTLSELADIVDENQPVALTDNAFTKDSMFYHIASENGLDTITEMIWSGDDNKNNKKSPTVVSIPIVSAIVAGMPADVYEDPLGYEEISFELAKTGDFVCLKVKGDSMSPVIQEGDLVIVRQQNDVESGDIAVIRVNGDEATLKRVQKSPEGITLIAYNPSVYPPHFYSNKEIEELPVEVYGKVIEMKRMF